jgi:hypothetical protein
LRSVVVLFAEIRARFPRRPIPGCPGRFVLPPDTRAPAQLLGDDIEIRRFDISTTRDAVLVAAFADGGLISYARPDGRFIHTLCTPNGFRRKLAHLGIGLAS